MGGGLRCPSGGGENGDDDRLPEHEAAVGPAGVQQTWATGVVQGRSGSFGASTEPAPAPSARPGSLHRERQTRSRLAPRAQSRRRGLCAVLTEGVGGAGRNGGVL